MKRDAEQFIERAGMLWEEDGLPRIAGRIFALTLISKDSLSLDEIAESLGVSKASVSNDTRLLERLGFIERVSRPGDRKDYYQSSPRSFEQAITERVRRLEQLEALIESGRALAVDSPEVRDRLEDHHIAFTHVTKALQCALEEIRAKRATVGGKAR
jgi:DNA-binding transcriptional regulator GbsR (MarR family)